MTVIKEIEAFNNGHKARHFSISIDDGYGATSWDVTIGTEKGIIKAVEDIIWDKFFEPNCKLGRISCEKTVTECSWRKVDEYHIPVFGDKTWAGLERTLAVALEAAKILVGEEVKP